MVEDEYRGVQARYYEQYFTGVNGDVEFYVGLAVETGPPVLELGCGTGRILIETARAGIASVGVDLSLPMLRQARHNLAVAEVANRTSIVLADMRSFQLRSSFSLATIPYRAFQHLLTPADQCQALTSIHNHLAPGGLLALNIFEPTVLLAAFGWKGEEGAPKKDVEFIDPQTGREIEVWYTRSYDPLAQLMIQEMSYRVEKSGADVSRIEENARLTLRYTYRYEMEHLLHLCGFKVKALYGDFGGGRYPGTGEQIWIAQRV